MDEGLQRQLDNVEADAKTWPDWKRREVGLPPAAGPDYDNPANFEVFHECSEQKQWELYRDKRDRLWTLEQEYSALESERNILAIQRDQLINSGELRLKTIMLQLEQLRKFEQEQKSLVAQLDVAWRDLRQKIEPLVVARENAGA